jgi:hypothetical protein
MKKLITTLGISALLLVSPLTTLAAENPLWDNPTENYSLPIGAEQANKSERLVKGHTYRLDFEASSSTQNTLLLYTQNRSYLDKSIKVDNWARTYTFIFTPKTNTKFVFEDAQGLGNIKLNNVRIQEITNPMLIDLVSRIGSLWYE